MAILQHKQLLRLHKAVVSARLTSNRATLLVGVDRSLVASLPIASDPAAQILSDLGALNQAGRLRDGNVPLRIWIRNALQLAEPLGEASVLDEALAATLYYETRVDMGASPEARPVRAPTVEWRASPPAQLAQPPVIETMPPAVRSASESRSRPHEQVPSRTPGPTSFQHRQRSGVPQRLAGAPVQSRTKVWWVLATIIAVSIVSALIWQATTPSNSPSNGLAIASSRSSNQGSGAPSSALSDGTALNVASLEWGPGYDPCKTAEAVIWVVTDGKCEHTRTLDWLQKEFSVLRAKGVSVLSDLPASFVLQSHENDKGVQNWYLNVYDSSGLSGRALRNIMIGNGVVRVTDLSNRKRFIVLAYGLDGSWRIVHQGQSGQPLYELIP